jgi:TolA-binding protein
VPDAAAEFREATAALARGDNDHAAALLRAFVSAHPGDSRAEDAAYLRVLALQRAGNLSGMQQAATEYLHRYPRGFRKAEVEPLAGQR